MSKKEAGGVICGVLVLDCGGLLGQLGTKIEDTSQFADLSLLTSSVTSHLQINM